MTTTAIEIKATAVTTDGWTWDDLCEMHWPRLVGYAAKRGCSDPESVAGETLADAVESIGGFTGDHSDFGRWLYTIAFRRITDIQRRWYRSPEVLSDDPTGGRDGRSEPDTPAEMHEDHETAVSAFDALSVLSDRDQRIIVARVIEERSVAEVAAELGLSNGAVRVYQSRALNKIRAHLESDGAYTLIPFLGLERLLGRILQTGRITPFDAWYAEAKIAGGLMTTSTAAAGTSTALLAAHAAGKLTAVAVLAATMTYASMAVSVDPVGAGSGPGGHMGPPSDVDATSIASGLGSGVAGASITISPVDPDRPAEMQDEDEGGDVLLPSLEGSTSFVTRIDIEEALGTISSAESQTIDQTIDATTPLTDSIEEAASTSEPLDVVGSSREVVAEVEDIVAEDTVASAPVDIVPDPLDVEVETTIVDSPDLEGADLSIP